MKLISLTTIKNTLVNLINHYRAPTPLKWRRIGDSLLFTALSALVYVTPAHPWFNPIVGMLMVGKFLTNFFAKDDA